uniref:Envelope glycoprotein n=1 Tax=Gunnison's prairie dog retrovirus TaxID=2744145 RepID=A0A7D4WIW8_9RETR|nr:Env [Gunnison's prairie dog retrovirus]
MDQGLWMWTSPNLLLPQISIPLTLTLFVLIPLLERVEGGFGPPPGNLQQQLFGTPCDCQGGTRSVAPTSYTSTTDCGVKTAYLESTRQAGGHGHFSIPKWVCVQKPKVIPPPSGQNPVSCPSNCNFTETVHSSCYTQASICTKDGKSYYQATLEKTKNKTSRGRVSIPVPGILGTSVGTLNTRGGEAGCSGTVGKPSCWSTTAPIGVSDGGGPTDAVKHIQVLKAVKPDIPKIKYHPLVLPKSKTPDLDANTFDILQTTFSLLNYSNPKLASDCWLCMTTGTVMPMAIPVNFTTSSNMSCRSGLPFRIQPLGSFPSCVMSDADNGSLAVDLGRVTFAGCSDLTNFSFPTSSLCPPNGTVFVCGGSYAYSRLPANWTGMCSVALLIPDITIVDGEEPLPVPSLDTFVGRHRRAIQALPLLLGLGISTAVGAGTAGVATGTQSLKLSQQIIDDVQTLSGTIKDLQDQIDSLAEVVLQNRRGLDLLTANQGGICLALQERCCFYANKSGIVRTKIKELQENLENRRKQLLENPLWTGLNGLLPYLLPLLGPLLGLLLIAVLGPCIANRITQFIKDQINILTSKPIQVHYQRLQSDDSAPDVYLRPIRR